VDLHYIREGEGPPIVVMGSSTYYARAFSQNLREHFELIFVDTRNMLSSYQPTEEELESLTLETFADDLESVRTQLEIDEWTVLGHSIQAQIALTYASKYPERTSRLVLVAGVPFSIAEVMEIQEVFWNEHASPERKELHAANRSAIESALAAAPEGRRFVVDYVGNAALFWADPTYDSTPLWEGVETGPAFGRLAEVVLSRSEARSVLESIEMPTLLVLGQLDFGIPHVAWDEIRSDLPSLTYVLLPEDGHNPQTEAPDRFDRQLIDWMDGD
jgi:proline iminopeptidase